MKKLFGTMMVLVMVMVLLPGFAQAVKYEGEYSPSFSPDGKYLAYHKNSEKMHWDIVVQDVHSGEVKQITDHAGMEVDPSWSADSTQLVYAARVKGDWDIYLYDMKTGKSEILVENPGMDNAPKWSPDGKSIAFVSSRGGSPQLYLLNLADKKLTQLTLLDNGLSHPAWTADGKSIIFDQFFKNTDGKGGRSEIYQVDIANKQVQRLYGNKGSSISAKRIGDTLYVTTNVSGNWDIVKVDLKTAKETPVANEAVNEMKASIHPGSNKVSYSRFNDKGVAQVTVKSLER